MLTFCKVKSLSKELPGVEEATSYGTPALKVKGKLMARLKEDEATLVVRVTWDERERLLATFPDVFFLAEHYRAHPWVLMRLSAAPLTVARSVLHHSWLQSAPPSLKRPVAAG